MRQRLLTASNGGAMRDRTGRPSVADRRSAVTPLLLTCDSPELHTELGGAMRDRTADLLNANQALSQLSYSPGIYAYPQQSRNLPSTPKRLWARRAAHDV